MDLFCFDLIASGALVEREGGWIRVTRGAGFQSQWALKYTRHRRGLDETGE